MNAVELALLRGHTRPSRPALVPELELMQSDELVAVWEETERLSGHPEPPPFWAFAWAGGQALARFILNHPEEVRGRSVLDFATGGGLVGLAALRAGALSVLAVDIDPRALMVAELNAAHNGLKVETLCADVVGTERIEDVVLSGDICYERGTAERIASWFFELAGRGHAVLIGDGDRAFRPHSGLRLEARYQVSTTTAIESGTSREGTVWRVVPLNCGRTP